ncbi:MAG: 3-oxoacyl-ACP synthase [Bacteroidetes bacterium]|jgi:3-oxoacyl-[acyl-carrier-protein] synthase-3|nr:3-oxoacyl-ACP synthase [Bacteroidota bacterium]
MKIQSHIKIIGHGKATPKELLDNDYFSKLYGQSAESIYAQIGVQHRYRAREETNTDLAVKSSLIAMSRASTELEDIDCILSASATFDHVLPNRSSLLKAALDVNYEHHIPCVDINTACTSFISALDYAAMMIECKRYKRILISSSEIASKGLNSEDFHTNTLFGDAAAAIIIEATTEDKGVLISRQETYSEACFDTIIPAGGNARHPKDHPFSQDEYCFQMNGKKLLKTTIPKLKVFTEKLLMESYISMQDIDTIVPHQASKLGLQILENLFGTKDKTISILRDYGNCIAASIPLALVIGLEKEIVQPGHTILLIGTAAGLGISGLVLKL